MPGTWSVFANTPALTPGTVLLLTDGTVLAQDGGSARWWRLRPDPQGDYAKGSWTQAQSASTSRRYYASAVLNDGCVFVSGGEWAGEPAAQAEITTTEIYDPVKDRWTNVQPPAGWSHIGDAPCCVLPDGRVLLGNSDTGACALFDPELNHFVPAGRKRNGSTDEESWVLLPDGSVLTVDCAKAGASERWVNGEWQDAGEVPKPLVDPASQEIGPALLLPDGRAFFVGATGETAFFKPDATPAGGTWQAGPALPVQGGKPFVAKDAPACLLPNGRIMLALSIIDGGKDDYGSSSTLFEFDGDKSFFEIKAPRTIGTGAYDLIMLLLPSGQMLLSVPDGFLLYAPDGAPKEIWRPVVQEAPGQVQPGTSYAVRGTGFNGLSQACAYGDDVSVATNYPLVRLRAADGSALRYCRSFSHSTMGVATGSSPCSTRFAVPEDLAPGQYFLTVIANAIASAEWPVTVLAQQAGSSTRPGPASSAIGTRTPDQAKMQQEMFWRDLNEVHLLLEFVQGRADKSLADIRDIVQPGSPPERPVTLTASQVVNEISRIRFPPEGSPANQAGQAELLMMVKDKLTNISAPARGLSIAYTAMFSGVGLPNGDSKRAGVQENRAGAVINGYATEAYPNIVDHARQFRAFFRGLPGWVLVWLGLTALVYWDVGFSANILEKAKPLANQAQPQNPAALVSVFATHWRMHPVGWFVRLYGDRATDPVLALRQPCACAPRPCTSQIAPAVAAPATGNAPPDPAVAQPAPACPQTLATLYEMASSVVDIGSDYVMPMMFGVLGTLAGLLRSILGKVRDSTLLPRDYRLSYIIIPLGAVAGLAVGLYLDGGTALLEGTPPPGAGQGLPSVAEIVRTLPWQSAALAFLAGYGADAFFGMLDGLLVRIFAPGNQTGRGSTP